MRNILLVSQSFYPNIGGVSSLMLNFIKQLKLNNYNVFTLHFTTNTQAEGNILSEEFDTNRYTIDSNIFSKEVLHSFSIFKEKLYQTFHNIELINEDVENLDGYNAFKEINEYFGNKITDIIDECNIEIVHFHDYQLLLSPENKNWNVLKVISLHFPFLEFTSCINKFLVEKLKSYNAIIVSVEDYKVNAIKAGLPDNKVIVIPPFVDEDILKNGAIYTDLIKIKETKNSKIILCVQRFDSKSGHKQLIRSFNRLLNVLPNTILLLVGGQSFTDKISSVRHDFKSEIEDIVTDLKLTDKVFFLGSIDYFNLGNLYLISDVVCMFSKMECFGISISEAMSFGKPVIATRVGGLKYQVKNNLNGFLIDVDDVLGATIALYKILSNENLAIYFSEQSKKEFHNSYLPRTIMKTNLDVYNIPWK